MLSPHETVFLFVAFVVVAKMVSRHFERKHEYAMKKEELAKATAPSKTKLREGTFQDSTGNVAVWIGILAGAIPALLFALYLIYSLGSESHFAHSPNVSAVAPLPIGPSPPQQEVPKFTNQQTSETNAQWHEGDLQHNDAAPRWENDFTFPADQYPSIESCAVPLARTIFNELKTIGKDDLPTAEAQSDSKAEDPIAPQLLSVISDPINAAGHEGFLENFKSEFKRLNPDVTFVDIGQTQPKTDVQKSDGTKHDPHVLTFSLENVEKFEDAFPARTIQLKKGKVKCEINFNSGVKAGEKTILTENFIEKPWLTDYENFVAIYPQSRFFVGVSSSMEPTQAQAHQQAVADAAAQTKLSPSLIQPQIAGNFTQTMKRPYGNVYLESVLVQLPKSRPEDALIPNEPQAFLAPIAPPSNRRPFSFEFSLAMLVCLTVVVGLISNTATQGYYRAGISRAAAIVCGIAIVSIILIVVLSAA